MGIARKLLILSPPFTSAGGVSSYVLSLKGHWSVKEKYFFRGNTGSGVLARGVLMLKEYLSFFATCLFAPGYRTVLVNTSMGRKALNRDNVFMWIAFLLGKKIIVFVHGWDQVFFNTSRPWQLSGLFRARKLFVLSDDFRQQLQQRGYKRDILVETTVVADEFIGSIDATLPAEQPGPGLLYLARLEREKGIMTLLEAFQELSGRHPMLHLDIAGFGSLENEVKAFIAARNLQNITYHGLVKGKEKAALFKASHIYVLPTSHGEGLPISVLEAMAAGLVVVTTSAGALGDFFRDGEMGYKLDNVSRRHVAEKIEEALQAKSKTAGISRFNYAYARDHFTVEKAISRLEKEIWK